MDEEVVLLKENPDDKKFFREKIFFGLKRWTWVKMAYLLIVAYCTIGFWLVQKNSNQDDRDNVQEAYQNCLLGNDGRTAIREVINIATATGARVDLTQLPSFTKLDGATQDWVIELNLLLNPPPGTNTQADELRKFAEEKLIMRNCQDILGGN